MTALPAARTAELLADLPGAFLAYGADTAGDVDASFDDAVEQAGYDHGFAGLVASVASIDADQVTVSQTDPVTLERALLLANLALRSGNLEPGSGYAIPICPDATYKRRRARVILDDPTLEIAEAPGPLAAINADLEAVLRDAATTTLTDLSADDLLESVTLTAVRHRYKPLVEAFKGKGEAEYVVLDTTAATIVSAGHRTAGEARRAAVALAKEGPIGGSATGAIEVVKVTRREGGLPFMRITRTRDKSRLVAKLVFGAVKNPDKVKTIGWLFFGHVANPSENEPTSPAEPADAAPEAGVTNAE